MTLGEIAARIGGRVVGDPDVVIDGVAGIREAQPGEITFLANPRYEEFLAATRASAVILHQSAAPPHLPAIFTPEPYLAFLEVLKLFDRGIPERPEPGIHPTAIIAPSARLGAEVAVGPWVVIGEQAEIGDRTVLSAGVYVGPACRIGEECFFFPQVVVRKESTIGRRVTIHSGAVIGDDGFGFAPEGEEYRKIPQLGQVVIEDDVEVGANTTIARATTGQTRIGRGSRLDNLVMIAHNVTIGENSILCAQVGISGSTRVGRHVILAGQVGLVGHITIGDGVRVGAQGGVTKSIPPGETYSGYPAQSHLRAQRGYAALRRLPDALRTLHEMELKVAALEARIRELEQRQDAEEGTGPDRRGEK